MSGEDALPMTSVESQPLILYSGSMVSATVAREALTKFNYEQHMQGLPTMFGWWGQKSTGILLHLQDLLKKFVSWSCKLKFQFQFIRSQYNTNPIVGREVISMRL
jgi:hypothetical protein